MKRDILTWEEAYLIVRKYCVAMGWAYPDKDETIFQAIAVSFNNSQIFSNDD